MSEPRRTIVILRKGDEVATYEPDGDFNVASADLVVVLRPDGDVEVVKNRFGKIGRVGAELPPVEAFERTGPIVVDEFPTAEQLAWRQYACAIAGGLEGHEDYTPTDELGKYVTERADALLAAEQKRFGDAD